MSAPPRATVYTLTVGATALTFTRLAGDGFDRWFALEPSYTTSKILRGTTRRTVVDVGGDAWPALSVRAAFATAANVATARGLTMQEATLSNGRGRTATVMLAKVGEVEDAGLYGLTLDLTFERLA